MLKKLARALLILVLLSATVAATLILLAKPAPDAAYFADAPRPLVLAHQGGEGLWPSNTLYAFQHAVDLGVDVLEMDMHATRDGALVLMHDATVDRLTDGAGAVKEMTLPEVKALDAGYGFTPDGGQTYPYRGQGITVPTVEEVFAAFPALRYNIEIKQVDPPIGAAFCQLIRGYGMVDKVLVASFSEAALDEFRSQCPEVATSASEAEVRNFFYRYLAFLSATYSPKSSAVQVPEEGGGFHILTPRFVRAAHARNLQVHAWTINEPADMQRLVDMGVDGIITDYPDRLLKLLGR